MKKLIIPIILLCFFIIPKHTYALDFTDCNNISHNVTDFETLRDYTYFTYVNDSDKPLFYVDSRTGVSGDVIYDIYVPLTNPSYLLQYSVSNYIFKTIENDSFATSYCTYFTANLNTANVISNLEENVACSRIYNEPRVLIPGIYSKTLPLTKITDANYSYQEILTKYNCNGSSIEPEPEEEVSMFDVVETFLVQFVNILPFIIPFILIMNLICRMLFNERS